MITSPVELRKIGSALQVTPGGNQVDGLPPAASRCPGDYGTIREMRAVFRRFSNFPDYSNHFSDFSGLDLMFAEAHARGFAPL